MQQSFPEFFQVCKLGPVGKDALRPNRDCLALATSPFAYISELFEITPLTEEVKVFLSKTERIESSVTGSALRFPAVEFDNFHHGERFAAGDGKLGDIRRRWWRRVVEKLVHDERSANNRRGALAVGTHRQKSGLPKQSAARRILSDQYVLKAAAIAANPDSIVSGE